MAASPDPTVHMASASPGLRVTVPAHTYSSLSLGARRAATSGSLGYLPASPFPPRGGGLEATFLLFLWFLQRLFPPDPLPARAAAVHGHPALHTPTEKLDRRTCGSQRSRTVTRS